MQIIKSKHSFGLLAFAGATLAAAATPVLAAPVGFPAANACGANGGPPVAVTISEVFSEAQGARPPAIRPPNNPAWTGYVIMYEPGVTPNIQDPTTWSDVVMFWDGVNYPCAGGGSTQTAVATGFFSDIPSLPFGSSTSDPNRKLYAGVMGPTFGQILACACHDPDPASPTSTVEIYNPANGTDGIRYDPNGAIDIQWTFQSDRPLGSEP